ncbi:POP4 [Blepharisma stoltei]|uniref:Uncharacterized protein n=1 Tax=Blepharisma stoltei TaxID=1481888 RepID=A0AAU9JQ02_9CILI|nr:unnamed protein product [Blepharisma stoltei]
MLAKDFFTKLVNSEALENSLKGRQFLLDNYIEPRPPKPKKGPGKTILEIPKEEQKYDLYIRLHEMWKEYLADLLDNNFNPKNIQTRLLKADMHGAKISVWKASCKSYEGQKGIILHETLRAFKVITPENEIKMFLKKDAIFLLEIGDKVIKLFGEGFQYRAADRAKIRWKQRDKLKMMKS